MNKISDIEILTRIRNKSTRDSGFRMLMEQYQEKIYWQIRRIAIEHEDSNDVLQEVFIKVWKNIDKFKEESLLSTWLYRIAYNEAVTYITSKRKMKLADWENEEKSLSQLAEKEEDSKQELEMILAEAIELLPEKQKIVFRMRYYDENKYEEMATITGTSVGALKASYHIAVKKIEEYVKEKLNQNQ